MNRIDVRLEIQPVAWALLHLLAGLEWEHEAVFQTSAWYNCRERGICIRVTQGFEGRALYVVFGECRGSDSIFVDSWVGPTGINPPTPRTKGYDKAYESRRTFYESQIIDAVRFIETHIAAFVLNKGDSAK